MGDQQRKQPEDRMKSWIQKWVESAAWQLAEPDVDVVETACEPDHTFGTIGEGIMCDEPVMYLTSEEWLFFAQKLIKLGGRFMIVVDKEWVDEFAPNGWVEVDGSDDDDFTIRGLSDDELEEVLKEAPFTWQ